MPSILFICTANQCRSPMALALFKQRLTRHGMASEWRVESAGTWAPEGVPPARRVQTVMHEWGIDLSAHRSRCVSQELLQSFDLILVMERGHEEALTVEFPVLAARVYLLSEMAGYSYDIPDPIEGSLRDVRDVACDIDRLLERGFDRIISQSSVARHCAGSNG